MSGCDRISTGGDPGIVFQIENLCGFAVDVELITPHGNVDGRKSATTGESISFTTLDESAADPSFRVSRMEPAGVTEFKTDRATFALEAERCP